MMQIDLAAKFGGSLLCLIIPGLVLAGQIEMNIAKTIEEKTGQRVESVTKTKFAELYEIVGPHGIAYTDKDGSFLVTGAVIDVATRENMTAKRMAEISIFKWSELPLHDAIKIVQGNGARVFATVEDPNCGYCKKLAPELAKLKDVTIYTFVAPVLGAESEKKTKAIWCAPDREVAWRRAMQNSPLDAITTACETPSARMLDMARKLRVSGTPAILFMDGTRIPGYSTAEAIEQRLQRTLGTLAQARAPGS
jgi:thiol:disulfide interchange protein DsbC